MAAGFAPRFRLFTLENLADKAGSALVLQHRVPLQETISSQLDIRSPFLLDQSLLTVPFLSDVLSRIGGWRGTAFAALSIHPPQNWTSLFLSTGFASFRFSPLGLSAFHVAVPGSSGSPVAIRPMQNFQLFFGRS